MVRREGATRLVIINGLERDRGKVTNKKESGGDLRHLDFVTYVT